VPAALLPLLLFALTWLVPCPRVAAADGGYFFRAATAFEEARYEDVLRSLSEGPETDETRYLAARAHAALEQYAQALDRMSEAPASFPKRVQDDFLALRTEWAAQAGRCVDLERFFGSSKERASPALLGSCAFRSGDFAAAVKQLEGVKDLGSRSMLAQALSRLGQGVDAARVARALWIEAPAHGDATVWADLAAKETPGLTLTQAERMTRAEAWLSARRADETIRELEGLQETGSNDLKAAIWHLRGEALFRTRKRYPEASKAFETAARLKGKTEAYDAFHAIRALSRAGSDREAVKRYEKYEKLYPKSDYAGEALYLSAWLSSRQQLPGAERKLETALQSKALEHLPSLRRDLLWDLSWLALTSSKPKQALRWLGKIPDESRAMPNAQRDYWRAVALLESGEKVEGIKALRESLWVDPLGYYAQLAARRLIALGEPAPPFAGEPPAMPRPSLNLPDDVLFYRRLGLMADAARASERFAKGMKDKLSVVAAHSEVGHAEKSHASAEPMLSTLLRGPSTSDNVWLWRAAFPEPYLSDVVRQTQSRSVPTPLFYGHMQVESRYKPAAVSGAEAIGLLQLLPGTAQSVARGLGLEVDRAALRVPATNITLGAAYLSSLLKRYGGQFPAAIAAYNAGTQRVDGWLGKPCPCELDRWVEEIPVEQTRNYVRRVITAWGRYHYLESPDSPWDLGLPSKVSATKP